jgi:PEGA domain-containing protein
MRPIRWIEWLVPCVAVSRATAIHHVWLTSRAYNWAWLDARVIMRAMARALVVAGCLVLAGFGVAAADGKTSKVSIETDPAGAKVYFGLKEDGEKCTTPCTIDAPLGETPIIIEAAGRRSIIENLVVPKKTAKPIKVRYTLDPAVGTLIVEGGNGATIKIDDEDKGKAPGRVEGVAAGAHHIVIEKNGKPLYDEFLEIEAGHEATVTPRTAAAESPPPPRPPGPALSTTAPVPAPRARRAGPAFAVTGTMDVAFRQFTYRNNTTPGTQRDDKEGGQVLAGPIVEVWPTTLLGLGILPGLALYGRFELGINAQPVTILNSVTGMKMRTSLSTAWRSLEVSLHQRWTIARTGTIEVGAGYADDRYQFKGNSAEIAMVPDASYKAVRIGVRASLLLHALEPYLAIENRLVLSGGAMDKRYTLGTSVNGFRGALGAAVHLGHIEVRLEGGLTRYSWTFKPDTTDATQAKGGTDFIQNLTVAVGYAY